VAWLALAIAGCGAPLVAEPQDLVAQVAQLEREMQRTIGQASCSSDSDCNAVPVGHKPCGGPARYLVFASQATDVARLQALAARHRDASRALNVARQARSDCAIVPAPEVACVDRRCVARDAPPATRGPVRLRE
jgi:uncharacterized low-complexity protein